jgi:FkbM family methyltransferase
MKNLLKTLARRKGVVAVTTEHAGARYVDYPPRGPLDEVLLRIFPSLQGLNFIQIGANDGVRVDPIRRFIEPCGWNGLLVEPVPSLFEALQRNSAGNPRLSFLNAAIDARPGDRLMYLIRPGLAGLPDWAQGLPSFSEERLREAVRGLALPADAIVSEKVRTVTWVEVLAAFGRRRCDLLVLDTEGHDVALLRLAELAKLRPRVIQFEHGCVSRAERMTFYGDLLDLGYELATDDVDTIAWRREPS